MLMSRPLPGASPARRMLVIDDESVITFAMHRYFTLHGFPVHCAAECEEALALLAYNEYDIIVADLRLTGTESEEGLEVIRQARGRSSTRFQPIVEEHDGTRQVHAFECLTRGPAGT